MDYVTRLARRRFKLGPHGERLFCLSGPWARPMTVPGDEEAHRTYEKCLRWERAIYLLTFVLIVPAIWLSRTIEGPTIWIVLAALLIVQGVARRIVFMRELRTFRRFEHRLSVRSYYTQEAKFYTQRELWLLVGLWVFMTGIVLWLAIGFESESLAETMIRVLLSVGFVLLGVFNGFLLYLKRGMKHDECHAPCADEASGR